MGSAETIANLFFDPLECHVQYRVILLQRVCRVPNDWDLFFLILLFFWFHYGESFWCFVKRALGTNYELILERWT